MKKIFKKAVFLPIITLVLVLISLSFPALPSLAAGTADVFIDAESRVLAGQNFTVTVRVETDIAAMVNLEIHYNSSILHCASADVSSDPGATFTDNGSVIRIVTMSFKTSHKYVCRFRFKSAGTATIKASVIECGTLEAQELPTPTLEKTITGYNATPKPTPTPTPTPTLAPTVKPTAQQTQAPTVNPTQPPVNTQAPTYTPFNPSVNPSATPSSPFEFSDGSEIRYIAEDFDTASVTMPEKFEKRSIKYEGSDISVAENPNGVKLLYTTDVLGANGKFYIYIEKQKAIIPYLEIPFGKNVYVFTMLDDAPESFTQTSLSFDQTPAIAYNTTNEKYSDFRILYGFTKGGNLNYYLYDTTEGTLQRCVEPSILYGATSENNTPGEESTPTATPTDGAPSEPTSTPDKIPVYPKTEFQFNKKILIPIIIAICVAAVAIAIIIILVRSRRIANHFDNDYANFVAQPEENIDYDSTDEEEIEVESDIDELESDFDGDIDSNIDIDSEIDNNIDNDFVFDTENNSNESERNDIPEEINTESAEESTVESFSSYYNLDDDEDEILQLRND